MSFWSCIRVPTATVFFRWGELERQGPYTLPNTTYLWPISWAFHRLVCIDFPHKPLWIVTALSPAPLLNPGITAVTSGTHGSFSSWDLPMCCPHPLPSWWQALVPQCLVTTVCCPSTVDTSWYLMGMAHFICQLDWLRDTQTADKMWFLSGTVRVCPEESSLWIRRLNRYSLTKKVGNIRSVEPWMNKRAEEGQIHAVSTCTEMSIFSYPPTLALLVLGLSDWDQHSHLGLLVQACGPRMNYTTSFLGSPVCRGHMVGLLSLHNYVGQFLK